MMRNNRYTTPPGKAEQYLSSERLKRYKSRVGGRDVYEIGGRFFPLEQKFLNWHGYIVPVGNGQSANILNLIQSRRTSGRANTILLTGPPGEGKSYFALRLAEIFDPEFDILDVDEFQEPGNDPSQIVFDRENLLFLIGNDSPLKRGQCIVVDESQFAAGNRTWFEQIQRALMNQFEAIRSRGYIVFIVALHRSLLDKVLREHVLSMQFHVEKRGKATVYNTWMPRFDNKTHFKRYGTIEIQLPDYESCRHPNCLECLYLYGARNKKGIVCKSLRAKYERRKFTFVGAMGKLARRKAEESRKREAVHAYTDHQLVEILYQNKSSLEITSKGNISAVSVRYMLQDKLGIKVGRIKSENLRKLLQMKHPEILNLNTNR